MPVRVQHGMVDAVHGKGGGYRLTKAPEEYRVGDILRLTEGDLAPVACLTCTAAPCHRAAWCRTRGMWEAYYAMTDRFFDGITLRDLLDTPAAPASAFL